MQTVDSMTEHLHAATQAKAFKCGKTRGLKHEAGANGARCGKAFMDHHLVAKPGQHDRICKAGNAGADDGNVQSAIQGLSPDNILFGPDCSL
jgi:hypothetical protein